MKAILTGIGIVLSGVTGLPAAAQWTEVRSENFVFQGEMQSHKAQALIQDLETYRSAAINALGADPTASPVPVRIFSIKPDTEFESLLPYSGFSVLSHGNLDGSAFLINDTASWTAGSTARQTLLQDLSRDLITQNALDQYPYWMQSGLADYLASSHMTGGVFSPGQPLEKYDYALSRRKWVPMKTVLGAMHDFHSVKSRNDEMDTEMFQKAQAWAAVHYIMQNPQWKARLPAYLNQLDAGESPRKAFRKAFGMSPKKFEKLLKTYVGMPRISKANPVLEDQKSLAPRSAPLSAAEAGLAYGEILRTFAYTEAGLAAAKAQLSRLSLSGADRAYGFAGQAEIAAATGDFTSAQSFMSKALLAAPNDGLVQKSAGSLYLGRFEETGDMKWLTPAKAHFAAALETRNDDPAVNFYYAEICARIDCPQDIAFKAASKAIAYYHDAKYIGTNSNLMPIFEAEGDTKTLAHFSQFARVWGRKG